MKKKSKLNQPDVEITTTFNDSNISESLNVNITIPSDMMENFISQQSIVDFKRNHVELNHKVYNDIKIEHDVITYNGKIYIATKNQSTFKECIKEWEERGWEVYVSNREIEILETTSLSVISIDRKDNSFWCNYYLSFELLELLNKTLKVLEEMKDG